MINLSSLRSRLRHVALFGVCCVGMVSQPAVYAQSTAQKTSSGKTPTAGEQKNDLANVKLAARIRRALVKDKTLSTRAHNITVIADGSTVTLRGAVKSEQEKQAIQQKVQQVAPSATISNLISVKE